jgi:threonine dehydrogenase-like Zn-dependent dehydrogenase
MCSNGKVFGVASDDYHLDGGMCEKISVPEYILYKIPDSVDFVSASLIEPLSIAIHAVDGADIRMNDSVVVFGAGTIGLMLLKVLKNSSASKVICVDLDLEKMELARQNNADLVIDGRKDVPTIIREYTKGQGVDWAFEAVGISDTINNALNSLRKGGTLIQLGNIKPSIDFPLQRLVTNELKIIGRYATSNEYAKAIDMLASGRVSVKDCISKVAPLDEGQIWFDKLHAMKKGLVKVVLIP